MSLSSPHELHEVGDFGSLVATVPLSVLTAIEARLADVGSTGGGTAGSPSPSVPVPVDQDEPLDVGATGGERRP